MSSSSDSATPPDAAAWLARGQSLEAQATPEAVAEAVRSYERAIALLRATPSADPALRHNLAVAHMNRGNALQKIASAESVSASVLAYDETIALLRTPPLNENPVVQNTLGAAWMNRGHALHRLGTAESVAGAVESHRAAIAVLQALPLAPAAGVPTEAILNHRLNLAGAWMNLANTLLDSASLAERHVLARDATTQSLALVDADDLVHVHPVAAELSLLARRARCDALGQLIFAVSDPALSQELAAEAGDIVDDGLALVRFWEQHEVPHFRPLGARLYHFGAQLYRINQPHFLAEFLLEHLDPAQSPGANPADPALLATATEAIAAALQPLRAARFVRADDPGTLRQVETLRSLQAAEQRLAEFRQAHLPPTTV
ncbi:MAG: hypothetical protein NTV51_23805 [Verrucomicrobia bacterium]|nr:hypothetical protein [Verrucomicrobiota bacterium]